MTAQAVEALAGAMRGEAGADYALAESGMAGPPDGSRRSLKYGTCWMACAGPHGVSSEPVHDNPWRTRREHQLRFARRALALVHRCVAERSPSPL